MSGTGLTVISDLTVNLPTTKPSVGSVWIQVGRDDATSTAVPERLHFSAWTNSGWFSTGGFMSLIGSGDVWITDVTNRNSVVFNGTLDEFTRQSSQQLQTWLLEGHTFRLFFRETSGPVSNVPPFVGSWSAPYEFCYGTNATLAKPHDATSMADAGLRLIPQTSTIAPDQSGDWGLETYSHRRYTEEYEIEIRNESTGKLYRSLTLGRINGASFPNNGLATNVSALLSTEPTAPALYSIRMRSLEGGRETNDAAAIETWTDWSAPQVFNIYVQPVVIIGGGGTLLDTTPTFRWKPVSDATSYEVWIGKAGTNQAVYSRTGIKGRNHTVGTALPNGDYEVYIRARLNGGGTSYWGSPLSMSIGVPPILTVESTANTVQWARVPVATRYEIWVDYLGGAAPAGSRFINETHWRRTTFTLPKSAPAGDYRIWIRAIQDEGRSVHRSTWSRSVELSVVRRTQDLTDDHPGSSDLSDLNFIGIELVRLVTRMSLSSPAVETPEIPSRPVEDWVAADSPQQPSAPADRMPVASHIREIDAVMCDSNFAV